MTWKITLTALMLSLAFALQSGAEPSTQNIGGDLYIGGSGTSTAIQAPRDLFAAGGSVTVSGQAVEDAHLAGFDLDIELDVAGNLYATGATVAIRSAIGRDLTAMGFSLRVTRTASVAGNARLMGGSLTIDGPISGAVVALGGEVMLNGVISGDTHITAETLTFGPQARIDGNLSYSTPKEIAVPERVASADRVRFTELQRSAAMREARDAWLAREFPVLPGFLSLLAGFLVTLAFFVLIGAIFLGFWPATIERLRQRSLQRSGLTLLTGVIGLSVLFGLIPISAITIIGIPLVPVVVLTLIVVWTLGYVFGAYIVGLRLWNGFGGKEPELLGRLAVLAAAVICFAVLNFIPVFGWLANFVIVLLGTGAIMAPIMDRMLGRPNPIPDVDMEPIKRN